MEEDRTYGRSPSLAGRVPEQRRRTRIPRMIGWSLAFLAALLVASGLFSSIETAFTSLTPGQISALSENRGTRGRLVKKLTERPDILLTTLLIGNNLANLGASALMTAMTIRLFGNAYVAAGTGILTLVVLVFCEVSPKQIALKTAEKLTLRSVRFVKVLSWVFRPIIWIITAISGTVTRIIAGDETPRLTLEFLLHHVKAAGDEGIVESFEEEMVRNVFRINDTPVEAIMTHRTELFTVDEDMSLSEAMDRFLKYGRSRAPVLKGDGEHVTGAVTLMDIVRAARTTPDAKVKTVSTKPYLVPGTLKAHELYLRLKKEPIHLAVVLDEYGGLDGVVTREDVMEEIFGELYDEREPEGDDPIVPDGRGGWIMQGDADFYDVVDVLGLRLQHDSRTHTVGGYLLERLERIPSPGTVVECPEGRYTVMEVAKQRIMKVRFVPSAEANE